MDVESSEQELLMDNLICDRDLDFFFCLGATTKQCTGVLLVLCSGVTPLGLGNHIQGQGIKIRLAM